MINMIFIEATLYFVAFLMFRVVVGFSVLIESFAKPCDILDVGVFRALVFIYKRKRDRFMIIVYSTRV